MTASPPPAAQPPVAQSLVALKGVSKGYGPFLALREVDFACEAGSIHAILGENGAGKSTMMKLLAGVITPTLGEIRFQGERADFRSTRAASRRGIVCIFQELSLMPALTVLENIMLARPQTRFGFLDRRARDEARACLERIGAGRIPLTARIAQLSLADRQLVEIAKALYQRPKLLILDEATSALGAEAVERVFAVIRELRDEGVGILFISHRFHEVHALADRISVFRGGRHVRTFPAGALDHDAIVALMIGESIETLFPPRRPAPPAEVTPRLALKGVSWGRELVDVSFEVRPGEIYGLGGLDGQGQQRVLEAVFGLLSGVTGRIEIDGAPFERRSPARAKSPAVGLALIPEDRKTEGLIPAMSIADNARLATLGRGPGGGPDEAARSRITAILKRLELAYGQLADPVATLSGGNQQKVLLAKWLALSPRCLLLLDPTRGIDVKTKSQIYALLHELAGEGLAVVLQSTDYEELIHLCTRVAVFYQGRIARELSGDSLTPPNLIAAAMGLEGHAAHGAAA